MVAPNPQPLRIRPIATTDLEDAVRYLDAHSATAADHLLDEFFKACERLAEMPGLGPQRRARGRLKGLRSWPLTGAGPYIIFYLPLNSGGIEVVRLLHGSRDIERELRRS